MSGGLTISALYENDIGPSDGLYLALYRTQLSETYTLNFIDVEVYLAPDYV